MHVDAIIVGSGMTGGWAAKELCEAGLKTLVVERGPWVEHRRDYTDFQPPWEDQNRGMVAEAECAEHYPVQSTCYAFSSANKHLWVRDSEHPYLTPVDKPFRWIRGYHLGGRSLLWWRQSYRWSNFDFESNHKDGHGTDWPLRYADLAPWYDHVEAFAGVSGAADGIDQLPDGRFQPPMEMTCVESAFKRALESRYATRRMIIGRCAHLTQPTAVQTALGRTACQYRTMCERGCSFGAYFSSLSATVPAARNTGNLEIATDSIVSEVLCDRRARRATGVRVINARTGAGTTYTARLIFLCASTIGSAQILLNSASEQFPRGLANSSDAVGRFLMDHVQGVTVSGVFPGFEDRYVYGRRPNGVYLPRYLNVTEQDEQLRRGFAFQGGAKRESWTRGGRQAGVGRELKESLHLPGPWRMYLESYCEMLPRADNRMTLHRTRRDKWGLPLISIDCTHGTNDLSLAARATRDAIEMLTQAGCTDVKAEGAVAPPGDAIHEMGTCRMGRNPEDSVLNAYNQSHDVPNLFITDGSCMASSACQNPSLTYMALTARAARHAVELLQAGSI